MVEGINLTIVFTGKINADQSLLTIMKVRKMQIETLL